MHRFSPIRRWDLVKIELFWTLIILYARADELTVGGHNYMRRHNKLGRAPPGQGAEEKVGIYWERIIKPGQKDSERWTDGSKRTCVLEDAQGEGAYSQSPHRHHMANINREFHDSMIPFTSHSLLHVSKLWVSLSKAETTGWLWLQGKCTGHTWCSVFTCGLRHSHWTILMW